MTQTRHCPRCGREWHNLPDDAIEFFHYCPEGHRLGSIQPARVRFLPGTEEARQELWRSLVEQAGDAER